MLATFDNKAWEESRSTSRDSFANLAKDFRLQRQASVAILETLIEADWMRTAYLEESDGFDLVWWIEHWAAHDREHLEELKSLFKH